MLLIEASGKITGKKNTTIFHKPGRVRVLAPAAAAMAFYPLQTYALTGGSGHFSSLRGGGPLTTLIVPGSPRADGVLPLWQRVWANVPCSSPLEPSELAKIFPWRAPTRTSNDDRLTTPADGQPLQAFWACRGASASSSHKPHQTPSVI